MKHSPTSFFQKIIAISFALCLFLFSACDLFDISVPDYIEKNINTAEGTDFQFVTETNGTAGAFYLIKPNQATELDIFLRNPQKFDVEPILEFLNGTDNWTETNPLYNSDVYIKAKKTGDCSRIRITIGTDGGFPALGTELPRMRLKLKNNELGRVYEKPYELPLMKCANNPSGGGDPENPLTPHIIAAVPEPIGTDAQVFHIYWRPGIDDEREIANVNMQFGSEGRLINKTGETTWAAGVVGEGTVLRPYIFNINLDGLVPVDTPLTLTVTYTDGTSVSVTENPGTVTGLPVYVDQAGGGNTYFGINHNENNRRANLSTAFNNVLSRYSDIKIMVSGEISTTESYSVPLGKTVVIEPSDDHRTIRKTGTPGTHLFTVEDGGTLKIKGNGANTLSLKGWSDNNAALIDVDGELIMETGSAISGNKNGSGGGGGVYVVGTFTMDGGTISENTAVTGGGVYVDIGGQFTMGENAPLIGNNYAESGAGVYITNNTSAFTMNGGEISENKALTGSQNGGGVYVGDGTQFTMEDGEISENEAANGGGVYINSTGTFTINGGEISGNIATNGNGIYISPGGNFYRSNDGEVINDFIFP